MLNEKVKRPNNVTHICGHTFFRNTYLRTNLRSAKSTLYNQVETLVMIYHLKITEYWHLRGESISYFIH